MAPIEVALVKGKKIPPREGRHNGVLRLFWSSYNLGFGQFDFIQNTDGTVLIDTEYMGLDPVLAILKKYFEDGEIQLNEEDEDV